MKSEKSKEARPSQSKGMRIGIIVVLVIIVITFISAPIIGSISGSGGANPVIGSYEGIPIYASDPFFQEQRQRIAQQYNQQGQLNDDNFGFFQSLILSQAFTNTAYHKAVVKMAEDSGMVIPTSKLDYELTEGSLSPYMRYNQQTYVLEFDEDRYIRTNALQRTNNRRYVEEMLLSQTVNDDFSDPYVSETQLAFIEDLGSVEKSFSFVLFDYSNLPSENIREYALENSEKFRTITLSKLTFESEQDAQQISGQLTDDPTLFDEFAVNYSDQENGASLGQLTRYELEDRVSDSENLDMLFALAEAEISSAIDNNGSWELYRCDVAAREPGVDDPETISKVQNYINSNDKVYLEDFFTGQANVFMNAAKDQGFIQAANEAGLRFQETGYFPVLFAEYTTTKQFTSENVDLFVKLPHPDIAGAIQNEFFVEELINLSEPGDISEPLILDDQVVVLSLTGTRDAPEDRFTAIREAYPEFLSSWRSTLLYGDLTDPEKVNSQISSFF